MDHLDQEKKSKRGVLSKYWLGTWNNYTEEDVTWLLLLLDAECSKYAMQEEIGSSGTKHLQFKVAFRSRGRPTEKFKTKLIHWEKSTVWKGFEYCLKTDTNAGRRWVKGCVAPIVLDVSEPGGWQLQVMDIVNGPIDKRKVHWFWEPDGCVGKSDLIRYLTIKKGALLVGGKAADMTAALALIAKNNKPMPTIVVVNMPKVCEHISYQGIESVKDGVFFSSKYESGMVMMNSPHFIVFSNREPEYEKMSMDRWNVVRINKEEKN